MNILYTSFLCQIKEVCKSSSLCSKISSKPKTLPGQSRHQTTHQTLTLGSRINGGVRGGGEEKKAVCKRDPILPLNSPLIQTCNIVIYIFNIPITIRMLHTITKRLEICIDINNEISEVDHYA